MTDVQAVAEIGVVARHPLDRLTAAEIDAARAVLQRAGLLTEDSRCAVLALEEPPKEDVLRFTPGDPVQRRVRAVLLDVTDGLGRVVVLSLTSGEVERVSELDPLADGQPPIMLDEFVAVGEIVKADPGWRAAMERRGVTDLGLVCPCPLSAGAFAIPGEEGSACCGSCRSCSTARRTIRGRTRSTGSSPTST